MMNTKYGTFSDDAVKSYKQKLHNKMFWLLLYQDPKTKAKFGYVDYDHYFTMLMKEICGLQSMVPDESGSLIEIMSLLQAAYNEAKSEDFDYPTYRKFVLDAHSVLDNMTFGSKDGDSNDRDE